MSSDSSHHSPHHPNPPSLHKAEHARTPEPAAGADDATASDAPQESIWQPLDGSAPRLNPEPTYRLPPSGMPGIPGLGPSARPGGDPPPAHQVAAVYAATAQAASTFTLAGWWSRCWAFLIDSVLFGIGVVALTILACLAAGMTASEATTFFLSAAIPDSVQGAGWLYAVLVAGRLLLGVLPALFLARWNGQTPGKRMAGLRVMRASGEPMTLRVALMREVVARVILLQLATIFTFGLGPIVNYLWPLWDPQRRAGHDFIADTRVVDESATR